MTIDYSGLGKRIKTFRTKKNLTQEYVAKKCGIGSSHLSNIETANAKVSLQRLVNIANVLEVGVDDLLCDSMHHTSVAYENNLQELFKDCSVKEYKFLVDLIETAKSSYRKNLNSKESSEH